MKKLLAIAVLAFGMNSASAQNKIGYINTDELISVMPEALKADSELKEYQQSLYQQGQEINKDADDKAAQFIKDSLKMSASMKEIKRKELYDLVTKANGWNETAQNMYNQKAQEKIDPIRTKALDAIKAVAKEKGYNYVLDQAQSGLLVFPPGDDLMAAVKAKLGIKDAPVTPNKPGVKPN